MNAARSNAGFSLVEMLVSLTLLGAIMSVVAPLVLESARLNKAQLMRAQVQSNARTTLSLVVNTLRTAGWDPRQKGFSPVALDSDLSDAINYIVAYADLTADGSLTGQDETVTIRQTSGRVEWRRTSNTSDPFDIIGVNITNDANGDGTAEQMFIPDSTSNPTRITVRVTAASPAPDPTTKQTIRYTISSDVMLRNAD